MIIRQLILLLVLLLQPWPAIARAYIDASPSNLDNGLDDRAYVKLILEKEIEIMRVNAFLERETHTKTVFYPWEQWVCSEVGSAGTFSGITINAITHWHDWHNPKVSDKSALDSGPLLLFIGHMFLLAKPLTNGPLELIHIHGQKKRGFDAKTTLAKVNSLNKSILDLMARRQALLARKQVTESENAETRVQSDLLMYEDYLFGKTYLSAKNKRIDSIVDWLDNFGMAATGGFLGALVLYLSIHNGESRASAPGGLGFVISGSFLCMDPINRFVARIFSNHIGSKILLKTLPGISNLSKSMGEELSSKLTTDIEKLQIAKNEAPVLVPILKAGQGILSEDAQLKQQDALEARKEVIDRSISEEIVGGTKVAWGIKAAEVGFAFSHQPKAALKSVAEGSTVFTVGTGYQLADVTLGRMLGTSVDAKKRKRGETPLQLLNRRLDKLDAISNAIATYYGQEASCKNH